MKIFIISDREDMADIAADILRNLGNNLEVYTERGMDLTEAEQKCWDYVLYIFFYRNRTGDLDCLDGYRVILQVKSCTVTEACKGECSVNLYSTLKLLVLSFYEQYLGTTY